MKKIENNLIIKLHFEKLIFCLKCKKQLIVVRKQVAKLQTTASGDFGVISFCEFQNLKMRENK